MKEKTIIQISKMKKQTIGIEIEMNRISRERAANIAKEIKFASPKPQQIENEKYAFRCWMLRLGFIGDEFKTARMLLLKNFRGNGAWRR